MTKNYLFFIIILLLIILAYILKKKISENFYDYKNIPIIINNFNQLNIIKKMVKDLHKKKYFNIIILDNKSTYKPLLDYYKKINTKNCKIIYLDKNYGHKSLWDSGLIKNYKNNYFIYTDADLDISNLPDTFVKDFIKISEKYKGFKIGSALKIDDLPDFFKEKQKVIKWEKKFWKSQIGNFKKNILYKSPIDTTFSLYPKNYNKFYLKAIRVGNKYTIRHMPWYFNNNNLPEDYKYYLKNKKKNIGHWSSNI
jgi:hypothetical protein